MFGQVRHNLSYLPPHPGNIDTRFPPPSAPPRERINDIEIVCISEDCQGYAETLEAKMKAQGLSVDILFPNPMVPTKKVIGNMAVRGVKFALCIHRAHAVSQTVNFNILQGEQEEHINIPVNQAMAFIVKAFNKHGKPKEQLPREIRTIIDFLKNNKPLSISELDMAIKYLVAEREASLRDEYGGYVPRHLILPPHGPNQDPQLVAVKEDIKNSIMAILDMNNIASVEKTQVEGGDLSGHAFKPSDFYSR